MIGQQKLIDSITEMVRNGRFPKTSILFGGQRSGKRLMVNTIIAELLNADVYQPLDLKVDSVRDIISDAMSLTNPRIYLFPNANNMTPQAQNALLKLAEEPSRHAHIIMTTDNIDGLLPTIQSRSIKLGIGPYTPEEIEQFTSDAKLTVICQSPGQVKHYLLNNYQTILTHCEKVVDNIGRISAANAFNILKHIDKERYDLLLPLLLYVLGERLKLGHKVQPLIRIVYEYKQLFERSKGANVQNALEVMFIRMRGAAINGLQ